MKTLKYYSVALSIPLFFFYYLFESGTYLTFREYQEFSTYGMVNYPLLVSSVGTMMLYLLRVPSLMLQHKKIVDDGVRSIPVRYYIASTIVMMMVFLYGWELRLGVLIINSTLLVLQLPILMAIRQSRLFTPGEKRFFWLLVPVIVIAIFPIKTIGYVVAVLVLLLISVEMPIKIFKQRSRGDVHLSTLLVTMIANSFWLTYGWAVDRTDIMIVSIFFFLNTSTAIFLWIKYPTVASLMNQQSNI